MSILAKHLAFVKDQGAFHDRAVGKSQEGSFRAKLHQQTAEKFKGLAADLEEADKLLDLPPSLEFPRPRAPIQLSLSLEDLEGLPQELIAELSLSDGDRTEFAIINAIEEAGGVISLDRLLIALYRTTGEIHKRPLLTSRLARMASKGLISYVPGKKGAYSLEQLSPEDVANLLGTPMRQPNLQSTAISQGEESK